jgi:signal transduction histidine kinase
MASLPSIRKRLASALLGWSVLSTVVLSGAVWLTVSEEVDELLDDTLQAASEVLSVPLQQSAAQTPVPPDPASAPPGERFVWQVVAYSPDGAARVLQSSYRAPAAPLHGAPLSGFSNVPAWRVYGAALAGDGRMLYVAQTRDERREAKFGVAMATALASMAMALLAHLWLRATARHELEPLQTLADRLAQYDALAPGASLGPAEREELQPVHTAIDALAQGLARRVAHERAFAAHAAHALRTPLAGIDAQLAVALRESPPALQARLQNVRVAAGRLQRVVTALLTLFRSGVNLQRQTLDAPTWLPRLLMDGLALHVQTDRALDADPDLLAAALLNLLDNAVRHGAKNLSISTPQANTLRLHDDGPGVSPERRAQLQSAIDSEHYEGSTGLGLMLADLVARAHGGRLSLPVVDQGFAVELRLS